jgi:protein involved in polysaccharide export with SLBB domain
VLKLDTHGYSPSVLNKIVQAAGQVKSHDLAAKVLGVVGEISISGRHVNRLTEEIGTELKEKRDRETEDYVHHRRQEPTEPASSGRKTRWPAC